ncbi:MAG: class I SAM-dependent DNA methyltransferase [Eggerthellaceae bacterium]|nr:class I SAM-dependent DNA methyltransferase [Eggerthellaceae bacterium]
MAAVFEGWSNYGKLDYVAAWYAKAAEYGKDSNVPFAFVSTNSICQGEVVRTLWEPLLDMGYAITFAYPTFVWNSEAADQAHVHVVIVGCSNGEAEGGRTIFYSDEARKVGNINGYLADAPNIFIESRGNPVNPGSPKMTKGSQPTDGGNLILSEGEKQKLETAHPELSEVIHQFMGGKEFINGLVRYCLWFDGCDMSEYSLIPEIRERLDAVRSMRESSPTASVQRDAATPWLFTQNRQPSDYFIALPTVSSARREYIPVGYLGPEIIVSDQLRFIPTSDKFILGLLMSKTHNAWMRVVCGRLKSDYRYAPAVWNSLVWPQASDSQKADIVSGAISVLDVRGNYPDASLATLYDPDKMPDDLKAAHTALDAAVEAAYGVNFNGDEEKIVAHLFKLYAEMTEGGK